MKTRAAPGETGCPANPQMAAARAVMAVVDHGRSLDDALAVFDEAPPPNQQSAHAVRRRNRQHARYAEICYGACRYYHRFDAMLAQLLSKPLRPQDRVVHFLLVNACYQLEYMRTPQYAAVHQSVEAVKGGRFAWAGGMINAVLRNFLARREELQRPLTAAARCAFPPWLYRQITAHWPAHAAEVLAASNRKPPLTLRVNRRKTGRDAYLRHLARAGIAASPTAHSEVGVTLAEPLPVADIPGFAAGLASVQDESAQLAVVAAEIGPGELVLDACAAPGGKTCALLEAQPALGAMVAVDLPARVEPLARNLARLGLAAEVIAADVTRAETWWDGGLFDRIVLDVPCSGSGVVRRHPDIKHRRKPADIARFAQQQLNLLAKAWSLLGNGGTLLYVTCSILPAENDAVIEKFLTQRKDAQPQPIDAPPGIATGCGCQRLPGVHPGDGFYFCRLKNTAAA